MGEFESCGFGHGHRDGHAFIHRDIFVLDAWIVLFDFCAFLQANFVSGDTQPPGPGADKRAQQEAEEVASLAAQVAATKETEPTA